uniref:Uncharacterized protein n=1 Tax=Brassica oleracea var. oleracea TaxID=109376 RepID=A0A0D3DAB4_BRAOL
VLPEARQQAQETQSLTFSTLALESLLDFSASPSLSLCENENRSTDELAASSSSSFVCSSTSLHRSRMPSPILASLLFFEHFLSSILREPDKILTLPPLVFTGDLSHRLHHWVPFALLMSVSLDIDQTLTFDFNFFPAPHGVDVSSPSLLPSVEDVPFCNITFLFIVSSCLLPSFFKGVQLDSIVACSHARPSKAEP